MAVTESDLAAVFGEWAGQLPAAPDRLGAVDRRIRRHRTRVRVAGAAAVCAILVAGVLVARHSSGSGGQGPAVRRGPSHQALVFPDVYAGSVVTAQVSGFGAQTRSTTLTWPDNDRLGLVLQCTAPDGYLRISTSSQGEPLRTSCAGPGATLMVDAPTFLPNVDGGSTVQLSVTADEGIVGSWAVGVLDRDPHWLGRGVQPAKTYQGRTLQHWISGGVSGSVSMRLTAADANPVFVLSCGQPGRLSLLLNGQDVGDIRCADAPFSQQLVPVSAQSLARAGYLPGRTATIAFGWEGQTWAYVGAAQYGG